jgi:hypothetical protein
VTSEKHSAIGKFDGPAPRVPVLESSGSEAESSWKLWNKK